ncbi:hypothetical protein PG985_014236 [Apiospora marii]|uniref:uncharacterized protein n=1 Tax=Apiospora marii TaxID=335849 RepID=UPI00312EE0F8
MGRVSADRARKWRKPTTGYNAASRQDSNGPSGQDQQKEGRHGDDIQLERVSGPEEQSKASYRTSLPSPSAGATSSVASTSTWAGSISGNSQTPVATTPLGDVGGDIQTLSFDQLLTGFDGVDFSFPDALHSDPNGGVGTALDVSFPQFVDANSHTTSISHHDGQKKHSQPHPQAPGLCNVQLSDITPTSSSPTSNSQSASRYRDTADTPPSPSDDLDFWIAQLKDLTCRPQRSGIPLDEMLHHSSRFLPRVHDAVQSLPSTDASTCATRLTLILICLTQLLDLFEQCISSMVCGLDTAVGSSNSLSLRLGVFQVDREAQQVLQMHVVGIELSVILQISMLIKQTLVQPEWDGVLSRTHGLLVEDLQVRTRAVAYQIKQKRGTLRDVITF